jgi:hypothetical protein
MSTDALLTFLTLVVALLALLPEERLLDLKLRTGALDIAVIVGVLVFIHFEKYYETFTAFGIPSLGPLRWNLDVDSVSYLALILVSVFLFVRLSTAPLRRRRLPDIRDLAERFLFAGRFAELLFLLERNLRGIQRFVEERHFATRWRRALHPPLLMFEFRGAIEIAQERTRLESLLRRIPKRARVALARVATDYTPSTRHAERLVDRVFLSDPFVQYLAKARPYFGLKVLEIDNQFFREAFLKMLLEALLADSNSILFEETKQNQNVAAHRRYVIDPLNPLLYYFLGEPFRAEEYKLYKPIGDAILEKLQLLASDPSSDGYRRPSRSYLDDDRWRCPIHTGLRIFDLMVTEALHRGVHWHSSRRLRR